MDKKSIYYSLIGVLTLAVLAGVVLWTGWLDQPEDSLLPESQEPITAPTSSTTTTEQTTPFMSTSTIGASVEGRSIDVYTFTSTSSARANSKNHLLFVGGIHGGYEWNSVVLAYNLIDYIQNNPEMLADNLKVSVVPSANPDAVYDVAGKTGPISQADIPENAQPGAPERFNANGVDLNRNFACNWEPTSFWRGEEVNAGTSAFSEPEARAIREFVQNHTLSSAVFFHSAAGAVYGAACEGSVGPKTKNLLNTYAQAAGYRAVNRFDAYPVTGDAESWMTKLGIPAVSVELSNHQDVEWQKNLAGIKAVLDLYTEE